MSSVQIFSFQLFFSSFKKKIPKYFMYFINSLDILQKIKLKNVRCTDQLVLKTGPFEFDLFFLDPSTSCSFQRETVEFSFRFFLFLLIKKISKDQLVVKQLISVHFPGHFLNFVLTPKIRWVFYSLSSQFSHF